MFGHCYLHAHNTGARRVCITFSCILARNVVVHQGIANIVLYFGLLHVFQNLSL